MTGTLLLLGIWLGLPSRWWPVDVFGSALAFAIWWIGLALVMGIPWARAVARWLSWLILAVGVSLVSGLVWTVSYLMALYGPVGKGGALILAVVAALLIPYLIILPASHLVVLRPGPRSRPPEPS